VIDIFLNKLGNCFFT